MILTLTVATVASAETARMGGGPQVASPKPAVSPAAKSQDHDRATGADEVGIGRSVGAVKSSGDEGGTAAGMPGKAPNSAPAAGR
jgi:hypothetical protein